MKKGEKKLRAIIASSDNALEKHVAQDILERAEDYGNGAEGYLKDLFHGGCQSGMVSHLIYYHDTRNFYAQYASEIDELYEEMSEELGESPKMTAPISNWLAWFGYEETAHKIANELGIEL